MSTPFRPPPLAPAAVPERLRRAAPRALAAAGAVAWAVLGALAPTLSLAHASWPWYAAVPLATGLLALGPAFVYFLVRGESEDGFATALYSPWVLTWLLGGVAAFVVGAVLGGGRGPLVPMRGLLAAGAWSALVAALWASRARRAARDAV